MLALNCRSFNETLCM